MCKYEEFEIFNSDTLDIFLASGGGNVLRIYPAD